MSDFYVMLISRVRSGGCVVWFYVAFLAIEHLESFHILLFPAQDIHYIKITVLNLLAGMNLSLSEQLKINWQLKTYLFLLIITEGPSLGKGLNAIFALVNCSTKTLRKFCPYFL